MAFSQNPIFHDLSKSIFQPGSRPMRKVRRQILFRLRRTRLYKACETHRS